MSNCCRSSLRVLGRRTSLFLLCMSGSVATAAVRPLSRGVVPYPPVHGDEQAGGSSQRDTSVYVDSNEPHGLLRKRVDGAMNVFSDDFIYVASHRRWLGEIETASRVIPATMIGISSAIILCTLLMYCSSARRRSRAAKQGENEQDYYDDDGSSFKSRFCGRGDEGSMTSASSNGASDFSGVWMDDTPPSMLPPMDEQRDDHTMENDANHNVDPEDLSLSNVSTLTDTAEEEERIAVHIDSRNIVAESPVDFDDDAEVVYVDSDCSSLTNGSESTYSEDLAGEDCVDEEQNYEAQLGTPNSKADSMVFSPSPSVTGLLGQEEERDASEAGKRRGVSTKRESSSVANELEQLEKLVLEKRQQVPTSPLRRQETSANNQVVRDIYVLPNTKGSKAIIGLDVDNATSSSRYPTVTAIDSASSFLGRIFEGDSIIKVNRTATDGLSGAQLLTLLEGAAADDKDASSEEGSTQAVEDMLKMVKVTVLSSQSAGTALEEDDRESVDLGVPDSCIEV